jgi:hypothetical protein
MANVINQVAFLRSSRDFPETNLHELSRETNKAYIEIAQSTNSKINGFFTTTFPSINGESWFLSNNQRQQALRQVFTFTGTSNFNHNIMNVAPGNFIRCFGSYTNGTNTFGFIFGNAGTPIAGQIVFELTSTQIIFGVGAGAPTVSSGIIVVEWISQV